MKWKSPNGEVELQITKETMRRLFDNQREGERLQDVIIRLAKGDHELLTEFLRAFAEAGVIVTGPTGMMINPFDDSNDLQP